MTRNGGERVVRPAGPNDPGLCGRCRHARRVTSDRGSVFYQCGRARTDARFVLYPRLPVIDCPGFERAPDAAEER